MSKVLTIIRREYLSRVKNKMFIISTLATPFLLALLMIIPILSAVKVEKEKFRIYVEDQTGGEILALLTSRKYSDDNMAFFPPEKSVDEYKESLTEGEAYLIIPPSFKNRIEGTPSLIALKNLSLGTKESLKRKVELATRDYKAATLGLTDQQMQELRFSVEGITEKPLATENRQAEIASAVGYIMGFLIYMMLILYGVQVMRGVIEEKTNRIVEVIVSSVKPIELMMGKIIGIGAVGLTQFTIWGVLIILFQMLILLFLGGEIADVKQFSGSGVSESQIAEMQVVMSQIGEVLNIKTLFLFIFYFLGGFLLYGSLFAAVGSAVDQESDSQQLTWPVMVPIMLPMLMISNIIQNPNGTIAVLFSHIPFFSPTIMMVRYAGGGVPWYELAISMCLLVLGIIGTTWLAARIYRVGILMYGKKVSFRELWKWMLHY